MKRKWVFLSVLLSIGIVGGGGYLGFHSKGNKTPDMPKIPNTVPVTRCDVAQTVTAPGKLINNREVTLEMPANGQVTEILVRPGDLVQTGQVLARIGTDADITAAITTAQLELLRARKDLDELQQNAPLDAAQALVDLLTSQQALQEAKKKRTQLDIPRASEAKIDQLEANYKQVEARLQEAQKKYDEVAGLPINNPKRMNLLNAYLNAKTNRDQALANYNWYLGKPSENETAAANAQIALAQAELDRAQIQWERLQDGPASLDVELARMRLANAEAQLAVAENARDNAEIRAPFTGVVLEVNARVGSTLTAYTPLFVLSDPTAVEVEATVIEEDFPYIEVGQQVNLFFDALPDAEESGELTRILPRRAPGDRPLYYVYTSLDLIPKKLVAGMTADASIVISKKSGVLCLPRALISASGQDTAVMEIWADNQAEKRTVELGLRGDVNVEIVSGLHEGDQVISR